jgi:hypothetical protein
VLALIGVVAGAGTPLFQTFKLSLPATRDLDPRGDGA